MITQKNCKFYLNNVEMPFLHIDDIGEANLNKALKPEALRRVLLTAIRKADMKKGDATWA